MGVLTLFITPKTAIPEWYGDRIDPEIAADMLLGYERVTHQ
jgi:hypothetical protein